MLDSIFAATYLSFGSREEVIEAAFVERFEFLAILFQCHFNTSWNIKQVGALQSNYMIAVAQPFLDRNLKTSKLNTVNTSKMPRRKAKNKTKNKSSND